MIDKMKADRKGKNQRIQCNMPLGDKVAFTNVSVLNAHINCANLHNHLIDLQLLSTASIYRWQEMEFF